MVKKIAALIFIYFCTAIAWLILGGTIDSRTHSSDSILGQRVASNWGSPQEQTPPTATYDYPVTRTETGRTADGKPFSRTYTETQIAALPLTASKIDVALELEHRQKGLLWYSTYKVGLGGVYTFLNNSGKDRHVDFCLFFPAEKAIYDDLQLEVDGTALPFQTIKSGVSGSTMVAAGRAARLERGHRPPGLGGWKDNLWKKVNNRPGF